MAGFLWVWPNRFGCEAKVDRDRVQSIRWLSNNLAAMKADLSWDMCGIEPADVLAACVGLDTQSRTAAPSEP